VITDRDSDPAMAGLSEIAVAVGHGWLL